MSELTPEHALRTFLNDTCPHCNGKSVTGGEFNPETLTREVQCNNCGEQWNEVYTLTGIASKDFTEEYFF